MCWLANLVELVRSRTMRDIVSKMKGSEAQEIAQWLRGLAALVVDLDSVLSTHMATHNYL